jgi:hypothetical protein
LAAILRIAKIRDRQHIGTHENGTQHVDARFRIALCNHRILQPAKFYLSIATHSQFLQIKSDLHSDQKESGDAAVQADLTQTSNKQLQPKHAKLL